MKKLLSMLLTLILCLGVFVSCNDETPSQSSSEIEKSVEFSEWEGVYYSKIEGMNYIGEDLPSRENMEPTIQTGIYYRLVESYEELLTVATPNDSINSDFFSQNAIFVLCEYSSNRISYDFKGIHNFSVDDGVATVIYEKFLSNNRVSFGDSISTLFFSIPKKELGNTDIKQINIIEKTTNVKKPVKLGDASGALENDRIIVVKNQEELNSFLTEHNFTNDSAVVSENEIGIIICRNVAYNNAILNSYKVELTDSNMLLVRKLIFDSEAYQSTSESYFEMINIYASDLSQYECSIVNSASYQK
ncbi:MAG: hypothetical protein IKA43_00820 [Clostridia bacterium]|nr:hypothetical protein [Clostridia bacterium]